MLDSAFLPWAVVAAISVAAVWALLLYVWTSSKRHQPHVPAPSYAPSPSAIGAYLARQAIANDPYDPSRKLGELLDEVVFAARFTVWDQTNADT